jgi:hypothetical protein
MSAATPIQTVATVCGSSAEAVRAACKVMGYRTLGGLILKRAYEFDSHFCSEVRIAQAMLAGQEQRLGGHYAQTGYPGGPEGERGASA